MIEGTEFFCRDADALVDASAIGIEHMIERAKALVGTFDKALPLCPFAYGYDMDTASQCAHDRFKDDIADVRSTAIILVSVAREIVDMCDGTENMIKVFDNVIERER